MTEENKKIFLEHAKKESPREACGLLVIIRGRERIILCTNKADDNNHFQMPAREYAMAADQGDIIGLVHSHPMGTPDASDGDRLACNEMKIPWYILGVLSGEWKVLNPDDWRPPLIGRQFAHGILDCYAAVRDHYRENLNIILPDYERECEWWRRGQNLISENFAAAGFLKISIDKVKEHDVLLMMINTEKVVNHCAVYLGNEWMFHHMQDRLSERARWLGWWRKNTVMAVRHKDLFDEKKDNTLR